MTFVKYSQCGQQSATVSRLVSDVSAFKSKTVAYYNPIHSLIWFDWF